MTPSALAFAEVAPTPEMGRIEATTPLRDFSQP